MSEGNPPNSPLFQLLLNLSQPRIKSLWVYFQHLLPETLWSNEVEPTEKSGPNTAVVKPQYLTSLDLPFSYLLINKYLCLICLYCEQNIFRFYCILYWMSIFWIGYKMPQQFLKHHMAGTGRFFRHFQFRALSLSRVEGHWPHAEILSVGNNLTNNDLIKIRKWTIWT